VYTNFAFLHLIDSFHSQFSLFCKKFFRANGAIEYEHKLSLLCCVMRLIIYDLLQGWTNPWRQIDLATTLCTVSPKKCWSSKQNLLRVTLNVPRIPRGLLEIWEICALLFYFGALSLARNL
jgi:hypothetical protein